MLSFLTGFFRREIYGGVSVAAEDVRVKVFY